MKQIKWGFALTSGCLKTSTAWTEPLPKIGINHIVLYNVFDKNYEVSTFVEELSKLINSPHGKINVMITLDAAPFSEMTETKKLSLPVKYQKACSWINRFPPDSGADYAIMLQELIDAIYYKGLMPYISWQLWQEPDSPKYFHGTYLQFTILTELKYNAVKTTGRPIYIGDFTSKKLNPDYRNYIETDPIFDRLPVSFSTSLYPEVKGVLTDYGSNYPTRNLPGSAIVAYSIGTSTNKTRINSDMWMVRAVQMLQWAYDKQIDYIYYWKLLECKEKMECMLRKLSCLMADGKLIMFGLFKGS